MHNNDNKRPKQPRQNDAGTVSKTGDDARLETELSLLLPSAAISSSIVCMFHLSKLGFTVPGLLGRSVNGDESTRSIMLHAAFSRTKTTRRTPIKY